MSAPPPDVSRSSLSFEEQTQRNGGRCNGCKQKASKILMLSNGTSPHPTSVAFKTMLLQGYQPVPVQDDDDEGTDSTERNSEEGKEGDKREDGESLAISSSLCGEYQQPAKNPKEIIMLPNGDCPHPNSLTYHIMLSKGYRPVPLSESNQSQSTEENGEDVDCYQDEDEREEENEYANISPTTRELFYEIINYIPPSWIPPPPISGVSS